MSEDDTDDQNAEKKLISQEIFNRFSFDYYY